MGLLQPSGRPNLSKPNLSKPKIKAKAKIVIRRPKNLKPFFKAVFILLLATLVIATAFYYFKNKDNTSTTTTKKTDPCAIFTLSDAKSLLGNNIQKGGLPPVLQSSNKYNTVVTCAYSQKPDTSQSVLTPVANSATVLLLLPKTELGKTSNNYQFGDGKPAGVQNVSGVGEKAFWDPVSGTLNVLKNGKWVILSNGPVTPASARTADEAKKLANIVVAKL
jgi:hypothetical protein